MAPYLHTARQEAGRPLPSQEGLSGTAIVGLFLAPFPTYMNGSARSANCCSFACFSVDYVQNITIVFLPIIIIISFRKMSKICKSFMWFIGAPQDFSMVYTTHISYLEIYNEMGYDLLDSRHEASRLEDLPSVPIFLFLSGCTCQQLGSYGVYFNFNLATSAWLTVIVWWNMETLVFSSPLWTASWHNEAVGPQWMWSTWWQTAGEQKSHVDK